MSSRVTPSSRPTSSSRRLGHASACALFVCLLGLGQAGCILFEDAGDIEGVDAPVTMDTSTMSDTLGDDTTMVDAGDTSQLDVDDDVMCAGDQPTACGTSCVDCTTLAGVASATCDAAAGECVIEVCTTGNANCNGRADDGCEAGETDRQCGASCEDCTGRTNVTLGTCMAGTCALDCQDGFLDCDGLVQNGCEQAEDLTFCGAACTDCTALDNVDDASCGDGACVIDACAFGFVDCNGDPTDGCEQPIDDTACGPACDVDCNGLTGVARAVCTGPQCEVLSCTPGQSISDGADWTAGCDQTCALGECWSPPPPQRFLNITREPDSGVILAGSVDGLVYWSDDGGDSWAMRDTGFDAGVNIRALAIEDNMAVAIGSDNEVVVSNDEGLNWERVLFPLGTGMGTLHTAAVFDGSVIVAGDDRLLLSEDGGEMWTVLHDNLPGGTNVRSIIYEDSLLLLGLSTGEVLRSSDGGETFVSPPAPGSASVKFMVRDGNFIYAGGNQYLVRTDNDGDAWEPVPNLPDPQLNWTAVDAEGEMIAAVSGSTYALFRPGDEEFAQVTLDEGDTIVGVAIMNGEARLYAQDTDNFGHVYQTDASAMEGDKQYVRLDFTHDDVDMRWLGEVADLVLAGGNGGQLWRSTDDGLTWSRVELLTTNDLQHLAFPSASDAIITAVGGQVLRTRDSDASMWFVQRTFGSLQFNDAAFDPSTGVIVLPAQPNTQIMVGNVDPGNPLVVNWVPVVCDGIASGCSATIPTAAATTVELNGTSAIVGTAAGELLQATGLDDGSGGTWALLQHQGTPLILNGRVIDVVHQSPDILALTPNGIYYSPDDGASWPDSMAAGAAPVFDATVDMLTLNAWDFDGQNGVAVGNANAIVVTTDGGATWTPAMPDPPLDNSYNLTHVEVNGSAFAAFDNSGNVVWSTDMGATLGETALDLHGRTRGDVSFDGGRMLLVAPHGQVLRTLVQ